MTIDIEKLLGAELPATTSAWDSDDVILYHVSLGAGAREDPAELRYVYEAGLRALPTFGVIPAMRLLEVLPGLPGLDADFGLMLHGEQELTVPGPLPVTASAVHTGRVAEVYDKGSAALVVLETQSRSVDGGELLCANRFSLFFRGAGGFGGDPGPSRPAHVPERPADVVVDVPTLPQQAVLYRLNGDKNPLHVDPAVARRAGFDRPILHGLCTYGMACKAVVDTLLDGDVTAARGFRTRFAGALLPGETLSVEMWRTPGAIAVRASCKERGTPVLSHAWLATAHDR